MHFPDRPIFLLASANPEVVHAAEPVLRHFGAKVQRAANAAALLQMLEPPSSPALVLIDTELGGIDAGWLVAQRGCEEAKTPTAIVLIADSVSGEQEEMVASGIVSDLLLRSSPSAYWRLRLDVVLRARTAAREMAVLRNAEGAPQQAEPMEGILTHKDILSLLFRETDRVQRLNSPLSIILFGLDSPQQAEGSEREPVSGAMFQAVAERTAGVLRSYDAVGCTNDGEFLLLLPGCSLTDARTMAERLNRNIFGAPFRVGGRSVWLSACFGIATSLGRSPVVVLREAGQALEWARADGPGSTESFSNRVPRTVVAWNRNSPDLDLPLL